MIRYHIILSEVRKQAKKENRNEVAAEAAKAHELMFNIAKHINVYTEDYNHILTLIELKAEMDRFSHRGKYFHHYQFKKRIILSTFKVRRNSSTNFEDLYLKSPILK